ncbi:hypothetical protein G4Z16_31840 [Streptomyces bathyalis]|uniref:Uncharacterized protein n=1 Tax=Streptomyces bathyalis TaxID=2710756 RepID=A0A7T1TC50_9ACTN|nr:hypothetical protein [Streptomyces bathyalis]QPP10259.1 hypothetical protein G4Z16_31840 [Streptomyces bathyalis]
MPWAGDAAASGAGVALGDPQRALRRDRFDVDVFAAAGDDGFHAGGGADAAGGAGALPLAQHVVGEILVCREEVGVVVTSLRAWDTSRCTTTGRTGLCGAFGSADCFTMTARRR